MKILAMVAIATVSGTASARNTDEVPAVPVCVETVNPRITLLQAEELASRMFAEADVTIEWRSWDGCPASGIRVTVSGKAEESDHPRAYAYAMPFEGTHIVLFWERIASAAEARSLPYLLAHVLVHEVTHILQGVTRHSDTGVMKAVFGREDIAEMVYRPLPFSQKDLQLIHLGIKARRARLMPVTDQIAVEHSPP